MPVFSCLNSYMSHLLSRENEPELRLLGRFLSNIIRGPTRSESDRHLCIRDERIRRDSFQEFLHKTQHSVYYDVHEERAHDKARCRSFNALGTPFWRPRQKGLRLGLSCGGPSNYIQFNNSAKRRFKLFIT